MSPQQAHRLVGQPDLVERLRAPTIRLGAEMSSMLVLDGPCTMQLLRDALAEIERLRTALRSVRASTDPSWANQIIADALRETET
jgi:hypothetical protein